MFIAGVKEMDSAPAEHNMLWRIEFHSAPNGAGAFGIVTYKHLAPPEQRNLRLTKSLFVKSPETVICQQKI